MESEKEFEVGKTYLIETEVETPCFEVFRTLTQNKMGLCVTDEHPDHIKVKYDLEDSKFARLSTSEERTSIGPQELDLLGLTIKRFISEDNGVILLHGTDYLISKNDTSAVIRLIRSIQERIREGSSILLIVLNTAKIEEKDVQKLKNELDLEIKSVKDFTEKEKENTVTEHGDHLVSQVRSMMEFLEEQEHYIEREEKKIDKKTPSGATEFRELEELKDEVETLREENRALKNELEKIKTEREEEDEVFEEEIVDEVVATVEEEKEDIEEQMQRMEHDKDSQKAKKSPALMDTLRKLEGEVTSLRDEVKTIKEESSKESTQELSQEEEAREEVEGKTDIIDSEIPSTEPAEDDQEAIDEVDLESVSDTYSEDDHEVIREPRLEDEYLTEEKESTEKVEKESMVENEEETDDRILYEENKTILKSNSNIAEDINSETSIEVQEGVTLKGSLKSKEDIILNENTAIQGDIISESGDVEIGKDCKINGEISGNTISISERSKVKDLNAKEDVVLKNNTRVRNILSQRDVKIYENVEIDGGIDYGGQLDLNGEYINIRGRIRPIDEEEEVVKEKWV